MVKMVSFETSVPYTSARCAHTSPVVNPFAANEMTRLPTPPKRRCATICAGSVPARSRGTSTLTGPTSVISVLVRLPLRALPSPPRSWRTRPRCASISPGGGGFQEPLGQLLQQPTLAQQRHTPGAGLLGQGRHRVVVEY